MKVATPHSLPEGESSSAGMIVSAAATKKACSVAVSVSSGWGSGAGDAAGVPCGFCASAGAVGARPVATAVPAPSRKLRRAIGILSSGTRLSVMATSPCAPHHAETRHGPREVDRRHATICSVVWSKTSPNFARAGGGAGAIDGPHAAERSRWATPRPQRRISPARWACSASAVRAGDRQELVGLQARAADQRAVDIGDVHELLGIHRLYRAAVEDADALPLRSEARYEPLADKAVDFGDVARRRRKPAADRPNWLIGNDQVPGGRAVRDGAVELRAHHGERAPAVAFATGLADADDRRQSCPPRGQSLGSHIAIGFPVIAAPLRMADDHGAGAGVPEHFRREIAGEGARRLGV